jgi:hypothetical protein
VQTHHLPILHCRKGKTELLIAYSPKIERLLDEPIKLLHKENEIYKKLYYSAEELNERLKLENQGYETVVNDYRNMSFWNRLKFLFGFNSVQ